MKKLLIAAILLGFAAAAKAGINFDQGVDVKAAIGQAGDFPVEMPFIPGYSGPQGKVDIMVSIRSENGEWIPIAAQYENKVPVYTVSPGVEAWTTYSCTHPNPPPNSYWSVRSEYKNYPWYGGHYHSAPPPPNIATPAGDDLPNPIYSKTTPVNTDFVFRWKTPAYATRITQEAVFSYSCASTHVMHIDVRVSESTNPRQWMTMPKGVGYDLHGSTQAHPKNHFGTVRMINTLVKLGGDWKKACPAAGNLSYNDISLPWGGLFDINYNWQPPHEEHKHGINIDVGKRQVVKSNREKLIRMMCDAGFAVRSEGDLETEKRGHYHLTLQPPGQTGWGRTAPFDMDPLGVNCCPANVGDPIPDSKCVDLYDGGEYIPEDPVPPSDCL
ncbi:MAG: hypothetical protein RDU13_04020 [Elusimicrobiales bacterium]|nr:hypothetical protein [Elusimicrobiales bacterium]